MKQWLLAFRPKTLTAALVPIFVGTAIAYSEGFHTQLWITLCTLFSALLIQIATNLLNDSIDFKKGADTEERIGPQRVTQSGLISSTAVMWGGIICLVIALLLGIPLVIHGGWPIVVIGICSLFLAYGYTGGPFPLAYMGLGDLFVILFFGLIAVGGMNYLYAQVLRDAAIIGGLQIGFLATVLIAINNLRDREQDMKVGKKTLAVRFGISFVRLEIATLIGASFALNVYWLEWGLAAYLPCLLLPLALKIIWDVFSTEPSEAYNKFLAQAALLHLGFGLLLSVGLYLR
jgi:1,4-dihydroxy-2-naphthoate octaprenyltransferase